MRFYPENQTECTRSTLRFRLHFCVNRFWHSEVSPCFVLEVKEKNAKMPRFVKLPNMYYRAIVGEIGYLMAIYYFWTNI